VASGGVVRRGGPVGGRGRGRRGCGVGGVEKARDGAEQTFIIRWRRMRRGSRHYINI